MSAESSSPLLILALDAGDPGRLLPWARESKLPTLASMLELGTAAEVFGRQSVSVHGIWATLFSGRSLAQHGGYARRTLKPGTYQLESVPPASDRAAPFWARLDDPSTEVLVIDAPETALVPGLPGRQIARWGEHNSTRPICEPPELAEEVERLVGPPIPTDEKQRGGSWRDRRILARILERVERKGRLCRALLDERLADIVVVGFGDTHAAGHRFGKYESAGKGLADAVLRVYQAIDREVAALIEHFESPPNVFVMADSGIREGQPLGTLMDDLCQHLGYKKPLDPIRASPLQARLRAALRPLLSSSSHKAWQEARFLGNTDWSQTSVFAIPATYTGYLRVNLEGREPEGIVKPGTEYSELLARLTADLELLEDRKTGSPVVDSVTLTTEVFGAEPPLQLPDLFVEFRPCTLPQEIFHPRMTLTRHRGGSLRDNSHSRRGLVLAAGPDIAHHGIVDDLGPTEVTPLFRAALGETIAADAGRRVDSFIA
ncbi:MAG: alkaline phosphatase family protein [Acidobacteriota bacterium]